MTAANDAPNIGPDEFARKTTASNGWSSMLWVSSSCPLKIKKNNI